MAKIISGTDGDTFEFPDSMKDEEILGVLREHYRERGFVGGAKRAGRGVAHAVASTAGTAALGLPALAETTVRGVDRSYYTADPTGSALERLSRSPGLAAVTEFSPQVPDISGVTPDTGPSAPFEARPATFKAPEQDSPDEVQARFMEDMTPENLERRIMAQSLGERGPITEYHKVLMDTINTHPLTREDPYYANLSMKEGYEEGGIAGALKVGLQKLPYAGPQAITSMVTQMALTGGVSAALKGSASIKSTLPLFSGLGGTIEGTHLMQEVLDETGDPLAAAGAGLGMSALVAGLESMGFDAITNKFPRGVWGKAGAVVFRSQYEALTESLEEPGGELLGAFAGVEPDFKDAAWRMAEIWLPASLAGGTVSLGTVGAEFNQAELQERLRVMEEEYSPEAVQAVSLIANGKKVGLNKLEDGTYEVVADGQTIQVSKPKGKYAVLSALVGEDNISRAQVFELFGELSEELDLKENEETPFTEAEQEALFRTYDIRDEFEQGALISLMSMSTKIAAQAHGLTPREFLDRFLEGFVKSNERKVRERQAKESERMQQVAESSEGLVEVRGGRLVDVRTGDPVAFPQEKGEPKEGTTGEPYEATAGRRVRITRGKKDPIIAIFPDPIHKRLYHVGLSLLKRAHKQPVTRALLVEDGPELLEVMQALGIQGEAIELAEVAMEYATQVKNNANRAPEVVQDMRMLAGKWDPEVQDFVIPGQRSKGLEEAPIVLQGEIPSAAVKADKLSVMDEHFGKTDEPMDVTGLWSQAEREQLEFAGLIVDGKVSLEAYQRMTEEFNKRTEKGEPLWQEGQPDSEGFVSEVRESPSQVADTVPGSRSGRTLNTGLKKFFRKKKSAPAQSIAIDIANSPTDPINGHLARMISPFLRNVAVYYVDRSASDLASILPEGLGIGAQNLLISKLRMGDTFTFEDQAVYIQKEEITEEDTMVEELLHAATLMKLAAGRKGDPNLLPIFSELQDLRKLARRHLDDYIANNPQLTQLDKSFLKYALGSVQEFVGTGLTNKVVRDFMQSIKLPDSTTSSVYGKFADLIRRLLGMSLDEETVLTKVIERTNALIRTPITLNESGSPSPASTFAQTLRESAPGPGFTLKGIQAIQNAKNLFDEKDKAPTIRFKKWLEKNIKSEELETIFGDYLKGRPWVYKDELIDHAMEKLEGLTTTVSQGSPTQIDMPLNGFLTLSGLLNYVETLPLNTLSFLDSGQVSQKLFEWLERIDADSTPSGAYNPRTYLDPPESADHALERIFRALKQLPILHPDVLTDNLKSSFSDPIIDANVRFLIVDTLRKISEMEGLPHYYKDALLNDISRDEVANVYGPDSEILQLLTRVTDIPAVGPEADYFTEDTDYNVNETTERLVLTVSHPKTRRGIAHEEFEHVVPEGQGVIGWVQGGDLDIDGKAYAHMDEVQADTTQEYGKTVRGMKKFLQVWDSLDHSLTEPASANHPILQEFLRKARDPQTYSEPTFHHEVIGALQASGLYHLMATHLGSESNLAQVVYDASKGTPPSFGRDSAFKILVKRWIMRAMTEGKAGISWNQGQLYPDYRGTPQGAAKFYDETLPGIIKNIYREAGLKPPKIETFDQGVSVYDGARFDAKYIEFTPGTEALLNPPLFKSTEGKKAGATIRMSNGRILMAGLVNPNISTALHEWAHFIANTAGGPLRERFEQVIGKKIDDWGIKEHEYFATAFEAYMYTGVSPHPELIGAFQVVKGKMGKIYFSAREIVEGQIPDEVMRMFDVMFVGTDIAGAIQEHQAMYDDMMDLLGKHERGEGALFQTKHGDRFKQTVEQIEEQLIKGGMGEGVMAFRKHREGRKLTTPELVALHKMAYGHEKVMEAILRTYLRNRKGAQRVYKEYVARLQRSIAYGDELSERTSWGRTGHALQAMKAQEALMRDMLKMTRKLKPSEAKALANVDWLNLDSIIQFQTHIKRVNQQEEKTLQDLVRSIWFNSMLGWPTTFAKNIIGNILMLGAQIPVRGVAGVVDAVASKISGKPRQFYATESVVMLWEIMKGFVNPTSTAYRSSLKHLFSINPELAEVATRWDETFSGIQNIPEAWFGKRFGPVGGVVGALLNFPSKFNIAMDLYFKALAELAQKGAIEHRVLRAGRSSDRTVQRAGLQSQQDYTKAVMEQAFASEVAKTGESRALKATQTMTPLEALMELSAARFAEDVTYQTPPDKLTSWLMQGRSALSPPGVPIGFLLMPFINTIANVAKRGLEYTPIAGAAVSRGFYADSMAEVFAKQIVSFIMTGVIWSLFQTGRLIGPPPDDPTERERFYAMGYLPYSWTDGKACYSLQGLEPFSIPIMLIGDLHNEWKNFHKNNADPTKEHRTLWDLFLKGSSSVSQILIEASPLASPGRVVKGERFLEQQLAFTGGSLIPYGRVWKGMIAQVEAYNYGEVKLRERRTFLEYMGYYNPFDMPPPKYNPLGEEKGRQSSFFREWVPIRWQTMSTDEVEREFEALEFYPGFPSPVFNLGGRFGEVRLTDEEYREYLTTVGPAMKDVARRIVSRPSYKNLSRESKLKLLNDALSQVRDRERDKYENKLRRQILAGQRPAA